MRLPLYQVDAFTGRVFGGNPAAVCPLERWLDDSTMQSTARPAIPCPRAPEIEVALGSAPREVLRAPRDYLAVFESEGDVRALAPSMERVAALDAIGV